MLDRHQMTCMCVFQFIFLTFKNNFIIQIYIKQNHIILEATGTLNCLPSIQKSASYKNQGAICNIKLKCFLIKYALVPIHQYVSLVILKLIILQKYYFNFIVLHNQV